MEIAKLAIERLNIASYNPRIDLKPGDKDYDKLKKSILAFGYIDPIIVNKQGNVVVGGHQRLKILREMGHETVEVSLVDLSLDQEKALNLALNKTGGDWDMPKLQDLLGELQATDLDIEITGFDNEEIERLMNEVLNDEEKDVKEDDFDPESAVKEIDIPITKLGDIWLLGNHRLICGDATAKSDVERLMNGELADLVITDPPYNVDYTGGTKDVLKIMNDKMTNDNFYRFLFDFYSQAFASCKDGAGIYIFHADSEGMNFRKGMIDAGFKLAQCCIWAKQTLVMGRQDYHWQHEPVLYGWKPTGPHNWNSDRKQTTLWKFDRPFRNELHPTMKPIPLVSYPMGNSSKVGDIILDLFGGSGSTLMAAEQIGRICYMAELDPVYCDVIVKRWEQLTGNKAVLAGG